MKHPYTLWLGSPASFSAYAELERQMAEHNVKARLNAWGTASASAPESEPAPFQLHGNVALVDIKGPLKSNAGPYDAYFGLTSYPVIRNSLVAAASHPDVKEIVIDIDSPGGSASGVAELGELIRRIDTAVPVTAYASGTAASAALWLGSSASRLYASETSMVGSLGVIATVMDVTGMLEQEGVKATVLRAGDKKALGGPYEPLTEVGKAEIQGQLDYLHGLFIDTIAANRGLGVEYVRQRIADGSEFIGEQARDVGLVDGITTLDALVGGLQAKYEAQTPPQRKDLAMAKRKLLSERQIALISEGVDPATALEVVPGLEAEPETPAVPETPEAPAEANPPAAEAAEAASAATPAAATTAAEPSLVSFLQQQLASAQERVTQLTLEVAQAERELSGYRAHDAALRGIVASSVQRMQIGLGGIPTDLSKLSTEALLSQHAQVAEAFAKAYPVGGKAVGASTEPEEAPSPDPLARARLRAVKTK